MGRYRRAEKEITKARTAIENRREELRMIELEKRKREFDKRSVMQRKVLTALGLSPYQDGDVIHRVCGTFRTK